MIGQPRSRYIEVADVQFFEFSRLRWLCAASLAILVSGCDGELGTMNKSPRPQTHAPGIAGIAVGDEDERPTPPPTAARPAAKARPPAEPQPILGRRTQQVQNAQTEIQQGGAQAVTPKIVATDPITLSGNAYVFAIGKTAQMNIDHALDLYKAANDRYPKDYDEFMNEIIKANNISLPVLPTYREYGYDEKNHKLIILEYPH